ncbi:pyridoxal kinase, putative [Plasmodium knowlesi strain H]|uniref:pyridoxal kinase n=3 Tax=Plasmodium knowlesi TaxID=5850 RepID=A0A5K1U6D3_PLAKH|nr:pyridoxal kinase, putative [Plasmodium knowlesi strain H]OTN64425.1 putative Pyridoxal kinase [Plasmodium knowlesi]CAA9989165.1 pyridoxal kinase, putative [Plasmodium knowlesi strain H]SBO27385.1 pyridoxal kinase, putative [Plasmodium knowlesi strain H]SBO27504.1 pyridoxal kinase, putative [Plasmodium knowlesi strain H]VVS78639.1 pyridoxal kinase, putative [Plasmodium knowlesi strain H]|eukprot:XP_002261512.1 pyridoxine kinase, putative [Plasmodium knowlesi strain H]
MNTNASRENIISIQSHVLDGFCGNNIASFVLRRRGHAPKIFNTVQYYSKYKHVGFEMKQEEMQTILGALKADLAAMESGNRGKGNHRSGVYFLTGYIKTKECVETVMSHIWELKNEYNEKRDKQMDGHLDAPLPIEGKMNGDATKWHNGNSCADDSFLGKLLSVDFLWICDPVMGDNGKLYVDKDVIFAYKKCIPFVDIMTPNQFELELLCDWKIKNENDVTTCILFLLNRGVKLIVVTSVQYPFDKDHLYSYVGYLNSQGELVTFKYKIIRFDFNACGSGDLFAALLLSFVIRHRGNVRLIVSKVLNIVHNVIKNSLSSGELNIIENQDIIACDGLCGNFIKAEPVCATHLTP